MVVRSGSQHAVLFAVVIAVVIPPCVSLGDTGLLEEARAANQATLESIRTLACRITITSPVSPLGEAMPTSTADYWWSAGASRVEVRTGGHTDNSVLRDGTRRSLWRRRGSDGRETVQFSIRRTSPNEAHRPFDAWQLGMLKLCGPQGCPLALNELLEGPHQLGSVKGETQNGREFVVVGLTIEVIPNEFADYEFWFEAQRNYLASKRTRRHGEQRGETKVLSFREVAPTIFFPEKVETTSHNKNKLVHHQIVEFSNIRVNETLPERIFELTIPPGAFVRDEILDKEYSVDAGGKETGQAKALAKVMPLPIGSSHPQATTEEPKPLSRWILPGSLGMLGVAVAFWLFRRWRTAKEID